MAVVIQRDDPHRSKKTLVAAVIEKYQRDNPDEWQLFLRGQRQERANLRNPLATDPGKNIQLVMSIPKKLMMRLDLISMEDVGVTIERDPIIWPWLRENYPEFRVPKKI